MRKREWATIAGLATGLAAGITAYSTRRKWLGLFLGLRAAQNDVQVTHGVPIRMSDGVTLLADHYAPITATGELFPTVLIRTPYDRRLTFFRVQRIAERGYNVLVQDVRGRFGSAGVFEPFVNEQQDGLDTIEWLEEQSWFDGRLGMWGASYLGYAQWAVAVKNPPALKAIVPVVTTSRGVESAAPPGVYPFELLMRWIMLLEGMQRGGSVPAWRLLPVLRERAIQPVLSHLPMEEAGTQLLGANNVALQQSLSLPQSERLLRTDLGTGVTGVRAPACLIGGWYDIFLEDLLADYATLRAAGQQPYLTIGPWQHMDSQLGGESLQQGLDWFDCHLKGRPERLRGAPVRVYVMGAEEWRELPAWPPPASERRYYLQPGANLAEERPPIAARPDHYRYNPGNPTPSLGGPIFMAVAGAVDNAPLEARADVLVYTTPPLTEELTIIGPVRAELFVQSSLEHTDFFARLCDVHPDGRSFNLCDGIVRVAPGAGERQPDGSLLITVNMWATANSFAAGHAIRLQVSSGAHPRFDRNLGAGGPPGKGRTMRIAEQTIYLDAAHPSALVLPVVSG